MRVKKVKTESIYERLICSKRLRISSIKDRLLDDEMLSDKARIVNSTAFRRLQVKAQVFSLEQNAAVRSRLTHTLEVATYGELIARNAAEQLHHQKLLPSNLIFSFVTIVQNACLLHDVGNPPFGHLGEYAMGSWFQRHEQFIRDRWANHGLEPSAIDLHISGLKHFDGNPQGMRIVTRLQRWKDDFGLNLSLPLLAAMVKYLDVVPSSAPFGKKPGFFETERDKIIEVWSGLGLPLLNNRPRYRYPLTFLMEAADDIAYCVSDIEDAIEKRILTADSFLGQLPAVLKKYKDDKPCTFLGFKTNVTRALVKGVAKLYVKLHDQIIKGDLEKPLLEYDAEFKVSIDWLKDYTRKNVFRSREAIEVELGGFRIITDLLDFFAPLLFEGTEQFRRLLPTSEHPPTRGELPLEQRMFALLSKKHLDTYYCQVAENNSLEPVYRSRLIVDYIAGMTDTHAVQVFRMLRGISAGE